jgi:hypothetical protein
MNGKTQIAVLLTTISIIFILVLSLLGQSAAPARADVVPTPAAHNYSPDWLAVTFFENDTTTSDEASNAIQLVNYELLDVQWTIDQHSASPPNTTTLRIEYSNDNTNWSDGPTLVSNNTADGDGMLQVANLGRYTRVYADHTGSSLLTLTVKAIAK